MNNLIKLSALAVLYLTATSAAIAGDDLQQNLNAQVVRVEVSFDNGTYGLASGVVVAKDQVVTNCHVVTNVRNVNVTSNGKTYTATAIKKDMRHDVCIVKVAGLDAPIATFGSSNSLKKEQPVLTVGYPGFKPLPLTTYGNIKGLYPMDDSVIIKASSTSRLGNSGGGLFDNEGRLVGIITLKSPSKSEYYYYMSVQWVQELINKPEQALETKTEVALEDKSSNTLRPVILASVNSETTVKQE